MSVLVYLAAALGAVSAVSNIWNYCAEAEKAKDRLREIEESEWAEEMLPDDLMAWPRIGNSHAPK